MKNWLLPDEFIVFRRLFFIGLSLADKYSYDELPIARSDFIELFFICCDALDDNLSLDITHRRRYKKAVLILFSKLSRDSAYLPTCERIFVGIRNSKYIGVQR